jgi:hypothetical protein
MASEEATAKAGEGGAKDREDEDAASSTVFSIFSMRRPQNLLSGISSGAKSFGRSVAVSAVALVALPIAGYREAGLFGVAKGAVAGVVTAGVLTAAATATAAVQVARGVANTPEALREALYCEKVWDETTREWVAVDLTPGASPLDAAGLEQSVLTAARVRKARQLAKLKSKKPDPEKSHDDAAKDVPAKTEQPDDLYVVLGVDRDAKPSMIKRAYAAAALQCHPDKNVGRTAAEIDHATARFLQVNEAYRVLSSPAYRAEYDVTGRSPLKAVASPATDASSRETFAGVDVDGIAAWERVLSVQKLLGGTAFLPVFGHLSLALHWLGGGFFSFLAAEKSLWERVRYRRCARSLARMLDRFLAMRAPGANGAAPLDVPGAYVLDAPATAEAARWLRELCAASYGPALLSTVRDRWELAAQSYLVSVTSDPIGCALAKLHSTTSGVRNVGLVASTAVAAASAAMRTKALTNEDALPLLASLATSDIQTAVDEASVLCLYDTSVPPPHRRMRAACLWRVASLAADIVRQEGSRAQTPPPMRAGARCDDDAGRGGEDRR